MKTSKLFVIIFILIFTIKDVKAQNYTLITYNVENLFDADSIAVFNDYHTLDAYGNRQYTKEDVLTKIHNITKVLKQYNEGKGPEIILFEELESDFSPSKTTRDVNAQKFLDKYSNTSLDRMLGGGFNKTIADLPSELLLLKGMADAGLTGYDYQAGFSRMKSNGKPMHVQKCVVFSRLPIEKDKTKIHPIPDARPILEVWLNVRGHNLIVFANHWKSGASSPELEQARIKDAIVLRNRLNILLKENPNADIIIGGDFNSSYNQLTVMPELKESAINTILQSTGNEEEVDRGHSKKVYNLWYELPLNKRGSEVYRGHWSTLMQIMISSGLYDYEGIQYVDNSYKVGSFDGLNVESYDNAPERWSSIGSGKGFSDHFPVSMQFRVVDENNFAQKMQLKNPGHNDDNKWKPIPVITKKPDMSQAYKPEKLEDISLRQVKYFDKLFYLEKPISSKMNVLVKGQVYRVYSNNRKVRQTLKQNAGKSTVLHFFARLSKYRDTWEFVIDTPDYILN
ncbi:MAG TPA: hypothetical protein VJ991_09590 [Balneolales bacterium]|nr:hypothetical protein [Balneolales bacterium]